MLTGLDRLLVEDALAKRVRGTKLALLAHPASLTKDFVHAADALIGLGASAIGRLPSGFVQNAPDIAGYSRAVEAGRFATVKGIALSADDRLRGAIIERLMCDLAVDLDRIAPERDFSAELESLDELGSKGVVRITGRRVAITDAGRPFLRLVAAAFDAYLPANCGIRSPSSAGSAAAAC